MASILNNAEELKVALTDKLKTVYLVVGEEVDKSWLVAKRNEVLIGTVKSFLVESWTTVIGIVSNPPADSVSVAFSYEGKETVFLKKQEAENLKITAKKIDEARSRV